MIKLPCEQHEWEELISSPWNDEFHWCAVCGSVKETTNEPYMDKDNNWVDIPKGGEITITKPQILKDLEGNESH